MVPEQMICIFGGAAIRKHIYQDVKSRYVFQSEGREHRTRFCKERKK